MKNKDFSAGVEALAAAEAMQPGSLQATQVAVLMRIMDALERLAALAEKAAEGEA